MKSKTYTVKQRRKREGKTDYRKRLKLVLSGKPRLVVRKSAHTITAQIVQYAEKGDIVIAAVRSDSLSKLGWNANTKNIPSAYLVGVLVAKKAKEKKVEEAILDIGLNKSVPGSKVFAVLKGAIDGGLNVPHSDEVLPSDERVHGEHIEAFAKALKDDELQKKFSEYLKKGADPKNVKTQVETIKKKITGA